MTRLTLLLLILLLTRCNSHNWMIQPRPYNRMYKRTWNCEGIYCHTACQSKLSETFNSRERPDRVYRRGEKITIKWTRNNHRGGFFRISLVPVDQMYSRDWHSRMTIMHGCWETGKYNCRSDDCGTDKGKIAYKRDIVLPDVFPDGDYVLGFVWYGGIYYTREVGFFGDYYSCSHVRVSGGKRLSTASYKPYFEAGKGEFVQDGRCQTSADAVGDCGNKGCPRRKSFWAIPKMFRGSPIKSLSAGDVTKGFGKDVEIDEFKRRNSDSTSPRRRAICSSGYCCPATCGRCGGPGCQNLPGGGSNCCRGKILESRRRCARVSAPCRM